jgi:4-amino-4-deoxy-L-arabinose transferase-like glycosyltransferase
MIYFLNPRLRTLLAIFLLLIIFVPFYLLNLYNLPYQINTDEIAIMQTMRSEVNTNHYLSESYYLGFPSFIFIVLGYLASLMGEINLYNVRVLHATTGLLIILISFLFFNEIYRDTKKSLLASIILGFSHSLMAISRMAMRDNSALLLILISFLILIKAIKSRNSWLLLGGGAFLGLGFYVYYPGRLLIVLWFILLALLFLFKEKVFKKALILSLLGFLLIASPMLFNLIKQNPLRDQYLQESILILEKGRQFQQAWVFAKNVQEGYMINVINGLKTFNFNIPDHGYIYNNPYLGFIDPLTGLFLWIGILSIILNYKNLKLYHSFIVLGFLFFYFLYSLVINKSPNYTRLLITLPFVSFLAVEGLYFLVNTIKYNLGIKKFNHQIITFLPILILIIALNLAPLFKYYQDGLIQGDRVGSTLRYIESKRGEERDFYLLTGQNYSYFNWGKEEYWLSWLDFMIDKDHQKVKIVHSFEDIRKDQLGSKKSIVILTNTFVISSYHSDLELLFPHHTQKNLSQKGMLVAIESNNP